MAAILACGPGAYLASLTAAVRLRLWRRRVTDSHLLGARERKLAGVRVRAAGNTLLRVAVQEIDG